MSGLLVGGGGGREREERAARWSAAVVKFSGSGGLEADIDTCGFGRSSPVISAALSFLLVISLKRKFSKLFI